MDLLEALKASTVPEWVHIPNTTCELNISKLSTTEMQRLSRKAMKRNKLNSEKLLELTYPKVIKGIRGLTLAMVEEKYGLQFPDDVSRNGQPISKADVIESNPIEPYWINFLIGLGKAKPQFHFWINEVSGQSSITDDDEAEED